MARPPARSRKPPADEATAAIRDSIRAHVPAAVAELARLAREATPDSTRISAIKELLGLGYGRLNDLSDGDDGQHGITVRFVTPPETARD